MIPTTTPMSTSVGSGAMSNGTGDEISGAVANGELAVGSYIVGSFPTDYPYNANANAADSAEALPRTSDSAGDDKPRILLMGLRR